MTATRTVSYWVPTNSSMDAIAAAKTAAGWGKYEVVAVEKTTFAPTKDGKPAWEILLRIRAEELSG